MTTLNTTWHHIRRSPFQTITSILVMFINFFIISSFLIISFGLRNVLYFFETKPEITIYLKDGLDKITIDSIQTELSNYQGVKEIRYISKEKALDIYKEQNKNKPIMLEMVSASILPASFEVSANKQEVLSQIAQSFAAKKEQVDEIIYPEDVVKPLLNMTTTVRKIGIIIISFFSLTAFLLIMGTISQKIANRKEEIKITRLLGASRWYVRYPFLLEGLIYGLISGFFGWLIPVAISLYFKDQINNFFSPTLFISQNLSVYFQILAVNLTVASIIGILASLVGSQKHIKF